MGGLDRRETKQRKEQKNWRERNREGERNIKKIWG